MAQLPTGLVTHSQKVCRLYKRALRTLENFYFRRHEFRYEAVLLRHRFDQNKKIPDARLAKQLLLEGEEEVFKHQHWQSKKFPDSESGIAHENYLHCPDCVMDYWDPMEKSRYPKYFAKREELKKEYEELYKKLFPETPKTAEK
ncbi:PREDICTED: NADH dehydrogenase [ubiquinone] 1 beta subcomplex subunit 9 [Dufourea novaeangliae]|uniref:NADH dehydrogenase [ubiquinone] 1 beta subcomplex subunit 9 n=1 Tax=Dufourea novaeangliae TaxID=178035 RepID=A0A154PBT9_DUFNO|nr:PREDICTED: NADH dehydrogenase [ubiquinone] 1 beta subcomplex subunit 9 [Dufourea novaeangliae]KZC09379.1 NADH dehydrogenase [ubiquinone] 1 beta subcomplex subunit 9 [Dufourea novaeangliae]